MENRNKTRTMAIEKRRFGRTGHMSSAVLFGGAALAKSDQDEADRVLDLLFEFDINHIDTAAAYGDSDLRIGPWIKNTVKRSSLPQIPEKEPIREPESRSEPPWIVSVLTIWT